MSCGTLPSRDVDRSTWPCQRLVRSVCDLCPCEGRLSRSGPQGVTTTTSRPGLSRTCGDAPERFSDLGKRLPTIVVVVRCFSCSFALVVPRVCPGRHPGWAGNVELGRGASTTRNPLTQAAALVCAFGRRRCPDPPFSDPPGPALGGVPGHRREVGRPTRESRNRLAGRAWGPHRCPPRRRTWLLAA